MDYQSRVESKSRGFLYFILFYYYYFFKLKGKKSRKEICGDVLEVGFGRICDLGVNKIVAVCLKWNGEREREREREREGLLELSLGVVWISKLLLF